MTSGTGGLAGIQAAVAARRCYYYAGTQRFAMRTNASTLNFFLGNHLGLTALTLNAGGSKTAELRYKPWGETRYTWGTTPTPFRFTGQRLDAATSLYFYNARYYDPSLGRFTQADTIVPEPGDPQSLNRYSYVLNNPLKYVDPSGHCPLGTAAVNDSNSVYYGCDKEIEKIQGKYSNVTILPYLWTTRELQSLWSALEGFVFCEAIASAERIVFARENVSIGKDGKPLFERGGLTDVGGRGRYKVTICDSAYFHPSPL